MPHLFGSKERRYKNADVVEPEDFLRQAGTGDILMHHGTSRHSSIMQKGMRCFYSHTSMMVSDPPTDVLERFGVDEPDPDRMYVFEATDQEHAGVRLVPWGKWIRHEAARNGAKYLLVWRKFEGLSSSTIEVLFKEMCVLKGIPFQKSPMALLRALKGSHRTDHLKAMFCSEAVAYALKVSGIVNQACVTSNMTTVCFSYYYGGRRLVDRYLLQGQLLPEKRVALPAEIHPSPYRH